MSHEENEQLARREGDHSSGQIPASAERIRHVEETIEKNEEHLKRIEAQLHPPTLSPPLDCTLIVQQQYS